MFFDAPTDRLRLHSRIDELERRLVLLEQSNRPICGSVITGSHCTECLPKGAAGSGPAEVTDGGPTDWSAREDADELDPIARAEAEFTLTEHLT